MSEFQESAGIFHELDSAITVQVCSQGYVNYLNFGDEKIAVLEWRTVVNDIVLKDDGMKVKSWTYSETYSGFGRHFLFETLLWCLSQY